MSLLRLLCFNIHGGYDMKKQRDLSRVHVLMDNLNVDIGVFQEMETRPSYGGKPGDVDVLAGPDRPYHLPGPTLKEGEGWYGNLLVSRYPIKRALVHNLETIKVLEPRNALDAVIDTPHGGLRVIGTHLSLTAYVRWSEVKNLIRLAEEVDDDETYPALFMGDMNEWRWPARLIYHLNKRLTPVHTGKTFPSCFPVLRLDRVWYDGDEGMEVTAQRLDGPEVRYLSDHLPLLIDVHKMKE
jgi:endonuclease/exonuclease/phosphatase family metal-dependent hydrolase